MSPLQIALRNAARRLGLTKPMIKAWRAIVPGRKDYEARFDEAMFAEIRPSDVIWDIGANVGLYTTRFLDRVAQGTGEVAAFEPAPGAFTQLSAVVSGRAKVSLLNMALGAEEGVARMALSDDPASPTNQIQSNGAAAGANTVEVRVTTGDTLIAQGAKTPSVVKIDVEGFEEEVLRGMAKLLPNPGLRAIFCEVHFGELAKKGEDLAPLRIERLLADHGFAVKWVDSSHISAIRRAN